MKVFKSIGSKERLFEMFNGVNKVSLNENFGGDANIVISVINQIKSGGIKITNSNSMSTGNGDTYVELMGKDNSGNILKLKILVPTQESDIDDVYNVNDAYIVEFNYQNFKFDQNDLSTFNEKFKNDIIDIVSKYINIESDEPEIESDFNLDEVIRLIDNVPYMRGGETIQSSSAYGDEKPTNPNLRVDAPELKKFVKEENNIDKKSIIRDAYQKLLDINGKAPNASEIKTYIDSDINESDYPNQIGSDFSAKNNYPKEKKKITKKVKIKEVEDDIEPNTEHPVDINMEKINTNDYVKEPTGGLADGMSSNKFDPEQLSKGIKVEMEHTSNPIVALGIAMDHLVEDPIYYGSDDEDPEDKAQQNAENDADELTDELLGYDGVNVGDNLNELKSDFASKYPMLETIITTNDGDYALYNVNEVGGKYLQFAKVNGDGYFVLGYNEDGSFYKSDPHLFITDSESEKLVQQMLNDI